MTKGYLIVGDYESKAVIDKIDNIISGEKNYELREIDGKISTEMVIGYCDYFNLKSQSDQNVGVIYDFNLISEVGQNKLLKTIEENMDNTFHIFLATSMNSILETILSRVILIDYSHLFKTEDEFYNSYINSIDYYKEYQSNEVYQKQTKKAAQFIDKFEFENLITYIYINVDAKDKVIHYMLFLVIINSMKNNKEYLLSLRALNFEEFFVNTNLRLQLLSLIINLKKEFYESKK
jgi:DNA polymerase III delta prime subunit